VILAVTVAVVVCYRRWWKLVAAKRVYSTRAIREPSATIANNNSNGNCENHSTKRQHISITRTSTAAAAATATRTTVNKQQTTNKRHKLQATATNHK
jgi:hypothetical protein